MCYPVCVHRDPGNLLGTYATAALAAAAVAARSLFLMYTMAQKAAWPLSLACLAS
jgi:hypothetical protein